MSPVAHVRVKVRIRDGKRIMAKPGPFLLILAKTTHISNVAAAINVSENVRNCRLLGGLKIWQSKALHVSLVCQSECDGHTGALKGLKSVLRKAIEGTVKSHLNVWNAHVREFQKRVMHLRPMLEVLCWAGTALIRSTIIQWKRKIRSYHSVIQVVYRAQWCHRD